MGRSRERRRMAVARGQDRGAVGARRIERRLGARASTAANPGGLGHITSEYFKRVAGIDMRHVPYRGGGPATSDAIAGHVQAIFLPLSTLGEHVRRGALVALALTAAARLRS